MCMRFNSAFKANSKDRASFHICFRTSGLRRHWAQLWNSGPRGPIAFASHRFYAVSTRATSVLHVDSASPDRTIVGNDHRVRSKWEPAVRGWRTQCAVPAPEPVVISMAGFAVTREQAKQVQWISAFVQELL